MWFQPFTHTTPYSYLILPLYHGGLKLSIAFLVVTAGHAIRSYARGFYGIIIQYLR